MIENIFTPTLEAQKIIIRQDEDSSEEENRGLGSLYPVIRIGEKTFDQGDIKSFSLTIGSQLIPSLSISIDDETMQFRQKVFSDEFILSDSLATIFIGVIGDTDYESIKADFKINEVTGRGTNTLSLNTEMYIPELKKRRQYAFRGSTREVLEDIATICGLGFNVNFDIGTTNKSVWICNTNFEDLLNHILKKSDFSNDLLNIFIDQYLNLNAVLLNEAFEDSGKEKLLWINGEKLDNEVELLISNNKEGESETDETLQLDTWSISSDMSKFLTSPNNITFFSNSSGDFHDFGGQTSWRRYSEKTEVTTETEMSVDSKDFVDNGRFDTDNLHDKYGISMYRNKQLSTIKQGSILTFKLVDFTSAIYINMNADFDIFHDMNISETTNQKEEISEKDAREKEEKEYFETKLTVSGRYNIFAMKYIFKRGDKLKISGKGIKI